jgi:hypothetical protein
MKRYLLNAMVAIMVLVLVMIPVISMTTGTSSGKDSTSSAPAAYAPVPDGPEFDAQLSADLEKPPTLNAHEWEVFKRLSELEPAQWERLCWLLEQYGTGGQPAAPAMDEVITAYDIELVSYVMPGDSYLDSPSYGLLNLDELWGEIEGGLEGLWGEIEGGLGGVGGDLGALLTKLDDIWGVVENLGEWFKDLTSPMVDTINSGLDIVTDLVDKYQDFTKSECDQLREDLATFVFGDETDAGLDDILWELVELVQWAEDVDMGIELPDLAFIEDALTGDTEIPCWLLFPLSLALEMTPDWQDLPQTIYDHMPHPGQWPSICELLLAEPAVGNSTLLVKFELDAAVAIFELIEVFVPDDLTLDIAGEGTTLPIAHPLKIIVGLTTKAFNLAAVLVDILYTKIDICGTDKYRAEVAASLAGIDADLAEHDTKISTKLDDHDTKISNKLDYSQWTLNNVVEHMDVDLQVIEIKTKQEFLVSASSAGIPLAGVEFTSVEASKNDPVSFVDITADTTSTMVRQGVYLLQIDLPKDVQDAGIFAFEVRYDNGEAWHYGFILFDPGA